MNLPLVLRARSPRFRAGLAGGVLLLAVVLAYLPAMRAGYVWDDGDLLTDNPSIVGTRGLAAVWTTRAADICPLTITALWAIHRAWGLTPWPYHLTNVLLHGVAALVLWRVLGRLRVPGAWLGAALWALHPVQVESVAWISEMKNTLSGVFYLLAALFFLRWLEPVPVGARAGAARANYALTLLCAALAMAGKTSTMVLPAVLCLLAWRVDGSWRWRRWWEIAPIFLLSLAAVALSTWTQLWQQSAAGNDAAWIRSTPQRLATAGDAVWFYLGKLLWPHPLISVYPRWEIDAAQPLVFLPLLALVAAVAAGGWLARRSAAARAALLAFGVFVVALLPVLGVVEISYFRLSFVADHFLYLASMGPLALVGAGLALLRRNASPAWVSLACAGLLLTLGLMSWQRAWVYRSQETLWHDALAKNPRCWAAYDNLGRSAETQGRSDEAAGLYRKALAINPDDLESCNNLGNILLQQGSPDEAVHWYQRAVQVAPDDPRSRDNLGNGFLRKGNPDEAILQYREAIRLEPRHVSAHTDLGNALLQKGRLDEAIDQYRQALSFNPTQALAHANLGAAFFQQKRLDEAVAQLREAVAIDPHNATFHYNLGVALLGQGHADEAVVQYREALKITPGDADLHNNLGNALARAGRLDDAASEYRSALAIRPDHLMAHRNLGALLAQSGLVDAAIEQYRQALKIQPGHAKTHRDLGDALVNAGELDEAIREFQTALRLRPDDREAQASLADAQAQQAQAVH